MDSENVKIGFIVTVEQYKNLRSVKYALNDGMLVKDLFVKKFEIPEDNIFIFCDNSDSNTTFSSTIVDEVQYYLQQFSNNTTVFFYYAGHGFYYNGKNYITAYDSSPISTEILVNSSVEFENLFLNPIKNMA